MEFREGRRSEEANHRNWLEEFGIDRNRTEEFGSLEGLPAERLRTVQFDWFSFSEEQKFVCFWNLEGPSSINGRMLFSLAGRFAWRIPVGT